MMRLEKWREAIHNTTIDDLMEVRDDFGHFTRYSISIGGFKIRTYTTFYIILVNGVSMWFSLNIEMPSISIQEETLLGRDIDMIPFIDMLRVHEL